jgi:ABC-type xylose transport system permease subunit
LAIFTSKDATMTDVVVEWGPKPWLYTAIWAGWCVGLILLYTAVLLYRRQAIPAYVAALRLLIALSGFTVFVAACYELHYIVRFASWPPFRLAPFLFNGVPVYAIAVLAWIGLRSRSRRERPQQH